MKQAITLTPTDLQSLDLTPAQKVIDPILTRHQAASKNDGPLNDPKLIFSFEIDFPREASDPRELSEISEVRLWFIRLDAHYPWLPLYLDWESGELSRYTAMLVPHQFSPIDGIRYNPEALEIFVMSKVFTLNTWLKTQGIAGQSSAGGAPRSSAGGVSRSRLKFMTQMLGYELDDALFNLLA